MSPTLLSVDSASIVAPLATPVKEQLQQQQHHDGEGLLLSSSKQSSRIPQGDNEHDCKGDELSMPSQGYDGLADVIASLHVEGPESLTLQPILQALSLAHIPESMFLQVLSALRTVLLCVDSADEIEPFLSRGDALEAAKSRLYFAKPQRLFLSTLAQRREQAETNLHSRPVFNDSAQPAITERVVCKEFRDIKGGLRETIMHILAAADNEFVVPVVGAIAVDINDEHTMPPSPSSTSSYPASGRATRFVLVMQDVEGEDLLTMAQKRGRSVRTCWERGMLSSSGPEYGARDMFLQLLAGLDAIHARGIAHFDIKPENIVLSTLDPRNPRPMFIDFGNAAYIGREGEQKSIVKCMNCTMQYAAPEVVRTFTKKATGFDHRADIFSLGMTFCVLLLNRLPYASLARRPCFSLLRKHELNRLENVRVEYKKAHFSHISHAQFDFLAGFFQIKPSQRHTLEEAAAHRIFADVDGTVTYAQLCSRLAR